MLFSSPKGLTYYAESNVSTVSGGSHVCISDIPNGYAMYLKWHQYSGKLTLVRQINQYIKSKSLLTQFVRNSDEETWEVV